MLVKNYIVKGFACVKSTMLHLERAHRKQSVTRMSALYGPKAIGSRHYVPKVTASYGPRVIGHHYKAMLLRGSRAIG